MNYGKQKSYFDPSFIYILRIATFYRECNMICLQLSDTVQMMCTCMYLPQSTNRTPELLMYKAALSPLLCSADKKEKLRENYNNRSNVSHCVLK